MLDLIVKNGKLVAESGVYTGDIGIKDGKIAAIVSGELNLESAHSIDATGKLVMPGFIDVHVHDRTQVAGLTMVDKPPEIARCGAYGGITTLIFYVGARWGDKPPADFFAPIIEEADKSSVVDFGIHCVLFPDAKVIRQVPEVVRLGISSFKMILGYHPSRGWVLDDGLLMLTMETIGASGGLAMFHCENGYLIGYLEDKFVASGKYTAKTFLEARPNLVEAQSVYTILCLARMTDCPSYIVHLSAREGLEHIIKARMEGVNVTAETCPQYLLLTDEEMHRQGVLPKMAPPIRYAADTEAMWRGIQQGHIEVVASDHASFSTAQKLSAPDFRSVPFGIPGIETIVPLIYSEGVVRGRLSLPQMAKLLAENPAKRFGLYPRKGAIRIGADADLVLIDPDIEWEIDIKNLHYKTGFTPYQGWKVKGKPVLSLLRGEVLLKDGELHREAGYGTFLARK